MKHTTQSHKCQFTKSPDFHGDRTHLFGAEEADYSYQITQLTKKSQELNVLQLS